MPIDPSTLDGGTPRTLDGREYPAHLRPYEAYDERLLPLFEDGELTFDGLVGAVADPRLQASVPRWLASAEWRGLVERHGPDGRRPRTYELTDRGRRWMLARSA
jgi:hypothetical protein